MRFLSRVDRVLAWWFIGITCAIVCALGALGIMNRTVYEPAAQVRQYFQALREGNGAKALGILGASVPESNAAMLTGDGTRNALAELKNLSVSHTAYDSDGEHATVTVSYILAGESRTTDFQLSKVGSHWGVFDHWHIDGGELPTVEVSSDSVDAATLNNVKVAVDGGKRRFAVFYPGRYTATYESALYSSEAQSVDVTNADGASQGLSIALQPSESALNSVKYQIKSQLDSCASQNTLYPAGCPFEYSFSGRVVGDVTWTVEKYPSPQATLDSAGHWVLPNSQGEAKISFTQIDLYTGKTSEVNKTVDFTYSGRIETSDSEVTVLPN